MLPSATLGFPQCPQPTLCVLTDKIWSRQAVQRQNLSYALWPLPSSRNNPYPAVGWSGATLMCMITAPLGVEEAIPAAPPLPWYLAHLRGWLPGGACAPRPAPVRGGAGCGFVQMTTETSQSGGADPGSAAFCPIPSPREDSMVPCCQPGRTPLAVSEWSAGCRTPGDHHTEGRPLKPLHSFIRHIFKPLDGLQEVTEVACGFFPARAP